MNKKTILGLLTGAAIVAATTGSYAAWDQLTANKATNQVFIAKPVVVSFAADPVEPTGNDASRAVGDDLVYTANFPITANPEGHENLVLNLTPTVTIDGTQVNANENLEINVYDNDQLVSGPISLTKDTPLTKTYTVKVTLKGNSDEYSTKSLIINLDAKITPNTPTN